MDARNEEIMRLLERKMCIIVATRARVIFLYGISNTFAMQEIFIFGKVKVYIFPKSACTKVEIIQISFAALVPPKMENTTEKEIANYRGKPKETHNPAWVMPKKGIYKLNA